MLKPFSFKKNQKIETESFIKNNKEIEEIAEKIKNLETSLKKEASGELKEKRVKEEIKRYLEEFQKMPPFAPPSIVRDEVKEIEKFPKTQQVGALIALVFDKGLKRAIDIAKALNNPAILDEFHDILVDRYYDLLIKKGILKNS